MAAPQRPGQADEGADFRRSRSGHPEAAPQPDWRLDTSAPIGTCWLSLPHGRATAFSNAIGLSAAARGLWNEWPEITGEDIFASATVTAHRRQIIIEVAATAAMLQDFRGWIRMQAHRLQGEAELARLGLRPPRPSRQRLELFRQMAIPGTIHEAWAFAAARILAKVM